jgi:hypothetical protein
MWPVVLASAARASPELPVPSTLSFGFPDPFRARITIEAFDGAGAPAVIEQSSLTALPGQRSLGREPEPMWPSVGESALPPSSPLAATRPVFGTPALDLGGPLGPKLVIPNKTGAERRGPAAPERHTGGRTERRASAVRERRAETPVRELTRPPRIWARMLNWYH